MNQSMKKIMGVVVIVAIGLLSLTAITTASDMVWPWSSEIGATPQTFSESGLNSTGFADAELRPDDNGYSGPIPERQPDVILPSEDGLVESADPTFLIPEDAPDRGKGYSYFHVAGTALRPRDGSVSWSSHQPGCVYLSAGDTNVVFNLHMDIPNGARVDYLRLNFYDTSSSDSLAWLTQYDDAGGFSDVTTVSTTDSLGFGSITSPLVSHVVNNADYSYILNWRPMVVGTTMQLCGLRVAYMLPPVQ